MAHGRKPRKPKHPKPKHPKPKPPAPEPPAPEPPAPEPPTPEPPAQLVGPAKPHGPGKSENPQFDYFTGFTSRVCDKCGDSEPLGEIMRCCPRCKVLWYCNRDCLRDHWKEHKKDCAQNVKSVSSAYMERDKDPGPVIEEHQRPCISRSVLKYAPGLDGNVTCPWTRLAAKSFFTGRSERDVFRILFDAVRVRAWDDTTMMKWAGNDLSMMSPKRASDRMVERFVDKAEKDGLLPKWWNQETREECIRFGHTEENWKNEERPPKPHQLVERYGTPDIILQLQVFAEQVYGPLEGRESTVYELKKRMKLERGELYANLLFAMHDESKRGEPMPLK